MWKCRFVALGVVLLFAFIIGCSGGDDMQGPIGPANEGQPPASMSGTTVTPPDVPGTEERAPVAATSGTTTLMGLWEVMIDKEAGTIEAVDMRSSDLILNVLGFLEPPAMSGMKIDFSTLVIDSANNLVKVDVILKHPLDNPTFMGFDVRGVVFGPEVTNADGLTVIPSPEYFNGVPFGYINGLLGVPDSVAHYKGLAGYKYFCKDLGLTDNLAIFMSNPANLANRGVFPNGTTLRRHYDLSWAKTTPPITFLVFNYAIYANYDWPTGSAPIDISDFDITTANSAEAFCAKATETANSLWYAGGTGGGAISMDIEVWDWQGNIKNVTIESVISGVIPQTNYTSTGPGSTAHSYLYKFAGVPGNPTTVGNLDLLITATDPVTFGEAWFLGLLPTTNPMYNKPVYNCWIYSTNVIPCPQPKPTSVVPPNHAPDNVKFSAVINGTDFVGGASLAIKLKKSGQTDIVPTNLSYVSANQISCDITLPLSTAMGKWDVEVVNGCGVAGTGIGIFEVICPTPVVSAISPNTRAANGVDYSYTITGSNFTTGPSLAVALTRSGSSNINATSVVATSATQITCNITIPLGTVNGQWNVQVTNGCGGSPGIGTNLFTVTCPTPTVTAITPNTRDANGVSYSYSITGTYFTAGSSLAVALTRSGSSNINATSPAVTSPTTITCNIAVPIGAVNGQWNVQVTNGCGGTAGVGANLFTVTCPTPVVNTIAPASRNNDGIPFSATITGSYFTPGSNLAVALVKTGFPTINATGVSAPTSTQINCTLTIPIGAPTGLRDVRVTNGCSASAQGTGVNKFTVTAAPVTGPKNIDLWKIREGQKVPAWDLAVDPKTGDLFILYQDYQIWKHFADDYTSAKHMTDTKDLIGGEPYNGWIDVGWERFMIVGLDYFDGPPFAAWIHHNQDEPYDPISGQVEDKYGYHAYGDVMASYEGGPQGPHAHHGVFGYVSKDCMTHIWHTQDPPFDPVQQEFTWKSDAPDYTRRSFMATLLRGLEWGEESEYFWAVKGVANNSCYAAAFRLEGEEIMYFDRYFGGGVPDDGDKGLYDPRDITRTIKFQNVVVDILSKYTLRLKGWDNDPGEPNPCSALEGMDITGLNGKPSEKTYRLRYDAEDNYHPKYGNILFILHGDDVNGYFLSLYYPSELPAWWPK